MRDRAEDVPLLLDFYMNKFNRMYRRCVRLDPVAVDLLTGYKWPGNVRELSNLVERLVIMVEKDVITKEDLPFNLTPHQQTFNSVDRKIAYCKENLGSEIERIERKHIIQALRENNGIQQRASKALGITPRQLGYRIKKYGIDLRTI